MSPEKLAIAGCYVVGYAAAFVIGVVSFTKLRSWPLLDRLIALVIPSATVCLIIGLLNEVLRLPFWLWNAARLAPAFALRHGYKLYSLPGDGPELNFVYGPLTAIAYLPATLLSTPTAAITLAGFMNIAFYFGPILWLLLGHTSGNHRKQILSMAGFIGFCFLTWESSALTYSAFSVHSDALSMGWGAIACAVLFFRKDAADWKPIFLCALFTVIALWTKLVVAPLPLALGLYLLLADGRRSLGLYVGFGLGIGVVVSAIMLGLFDARALIFKMLKIPAGVAANFPPEIRPLTVVQELALGLIAPVSIIAACAVAKPRLIPGKWFAGLVTWLRENRWTIFFIAGIFMIPLSIPHRYGHGGSENALSPPVYFLLVAAVVCLTEASVRSDATDGGALQRAFKAVLLVMTVVFSIVKFSSPNVTAARLSDWPNNPQQQVFAATHRSPGSVYFPDFPLAVLMGEGKLYHFSFGIADLDNAGYPLSTEGMQAFIPPHARQVIFYVPHWVQATMKHLPQYSRQVPDPEGRYVFERP